MVKKKKATTAQDFSKYIRWFWMLFVGGVFFVTLLFLLASWGAFGEMPDHTVLENPKTHLATEIISSDGETLGRFYLNDNRTPVSYDELSQNLVDALIATEDARFKEHSGIDARGTLRAFFFLGKKGGASTISQQLARQLFVGVRSKGWDKYLQKIKEWIIAIRLERQYTKEEIIAQYFNIYDFGNNGDGIRSAAEIYFGKEPKDLDMKESAMLVGMFKSSIIYNPRRHPVRTKNRRNIVLHQLEYYNYIDEAVKDSLQKTELDLRYSPQSHRDGIATYFRNYLSKFMKDWINKNPKPDGTKYSLYNDGLKIYTTIDSRMQRYAEAAVQQHMPRLQAEFFNQNTPERNPTAPFLGLDRTGINALMKRYMRRGERWRILKKAGKSNAEIEASFYKPTQMTVFEWKDGKASEVDTIMKPIDSMRYYKSFLRPGMMSMDPLTGHVKAWVGGMNYRHFQYDMVKQGKRQVGSTFKPFVYATAIDQLHYSPCDEFPNTPFCIEKNKHGNSEEWCPENANGENDYGGTKTLKNALATSVNTITARLIDKVGPQLVVDLAKKLGIESEIPVLPSIALGVSEISLYEMVGAYSTFVNKGVYTKPVMVTTIKDKNDTVLYEFKPKTRVVLSEEIAYVVVNLLRGVTEGGSGSNLKHDHKANRIDYKKIITGYPYKFKNPIAGKTGTTQNQSDGWFMGMVPNLVTGVWVGAEDRFAHFKSITYGQGASTALPIWGLYMKSCYADETLNISTEPFEKPKDLSINVDCSDVSEIIDDDSSNGIPEGLDKF
ncbi:transglycosylase domain-containing protein [Flavivirga aquimarina]|uniref:Transglycosylase domain-containing protein n=1 Tax=Flavivirga aquimarina TaxID=2027862 RepID=A0ABT8WFN6_9FLAO|nr:transglycosylase domain-containing protein [Flavivirga aquimarina]MDO5971965.1 transglycosylase domain-containing protein [Flavivirga aquimarina]